VPGTRTKRGESDLGEDIGGRDNKTRGRERRWGRREEMTQDAFKCGQAPRSTRDRHKTKKPVLKQTKEKEVRCEQGSQGEGVGGRSRIDRSNKQHRGDK